MNENDLKKVAAEAGKALGDASVAANAEVQRRGPAVLAFIKRHKWWFIVAVVALVAGGLGF